MAAQPSADWLERLLDATAAAVVAVDLQGRTLFWNAAAEQLFGWSRADVLGLPPPIVPVALQQEWQLQMRRVLESAPETAAAPAAETQRLTRDGRLVSVLRSSAPLRDGGGRLIGLVDTLTDIATHKQLDEQSRALAQVRERELIAMDLHDGLIQSLYGIVLGLAAAERRLGDASSGSSVATDAAPEVSPAAEPGTARWDPETGEETPLEDLAHAEPDATTPAPDVAAASPSASADRAAAALREARQQVEQLIEETRSYLFDLRVREFSPPDLAAGLRLLVDGLRLNSGIRATLELDAAAEAALPPGARGHVLYLVREAVSNVVRHAGASCVELRVGREPTTGRVTVTLSDDGRGFVLPASGGAGHNGLRNMAERARLIGGRLEISSQPGHGTRVRLDIPSP